MATTIRTDHGELTGGDPARIVERRYGPGTTILYTDADSTIAGYIVRELKPLRILRILATIETITINQETNHA